MSESSDCWRVALTLQLSPQKAIAVTWLQGIKFKSSTWMCGGVRHWIYFFNTKYVKVVCWIFVSFYKIPLTKWKLEKWLFNAVSVLNFSFVDIASHTLSPFLKMAIIIQIHPVIWLMRQIRCQNYKEC